MKLCSILGCGNPHEARGWCRRHYVRWCSHGDPEGGGAYRSRRGSLIEWLDTYATLDACHHDPCLLWPFNVGKNGYGTFRIGSKTFAVHRHVCEQAYGPAPTGRNDAAHSCGVRRCCNPHHLRWATRKENEADKKLNPHVNMKTQ